MANVEVDVRNQNLEKALKVFNRKVRKTGVLREYKERMHYTKPSEERRDKRKKAEAKAKRHGEERQYR